jgi:hypothetical protein
MKIHNLMIYNGYCEDQEVAPVLMCHDQGFDTAQEALESIKEILTKLSKKTNCECDSKYKQFTYCGNCRRSVKPPEPILNDTWRTIRNGTLDSLADIYEVFEQEGWILGCYADATLGEETILRFHSYLESGSAYFIGGNYIS